MTARAKREGAYKSGIGMDSSYMQADLDIVQEEEADSNDRKPAASKKRKSKNGPQKNKGGSMACICGGIDHQQTSSCKCRFHG